MLTEWMKKEGNPGTDSHSMEGTWMSPRSWGLTGGSTITPSSQQAVTPLTVKPDKLLNLPVPQLSSSVKWAIVRIKEGNEHESPQHCL